jgi:putative thioredoxin
MALIGLGQPKKSAPGTTGPHGDVIKDGTDASFKADIIDTSMQTPVLVDFWAPWCGPCRTLTPIIEKVVVAAKGKVKLVKINIDENPGFAGQLRVQSIPAVFAFKDGKPVDGFMGAQPESQIKAFIDRLIGDVPDGIDDLLAAGAESLSIGDIGGAAQSYAQAASLDPQNATAIAGLARCYLLGGNVEQARELIATIPKDKAKDPSVVAVMAQLALSEAASQAGDATALAASVKASPDNLQAWFDLAMARIGEGDLDGASKALLEIIARERNWNDDAARKQLLTLFEAAGPASETARNGRRRLSAILFS